jgi:hypothetical protein
MQEISTLTRDVRKLAYLILASNIGPKECRLFVCISVICQLLGFESTLPLAGLRCFVVHASGEKEARRGILGEKTSSFSNTLYLVGMIKMASADVVGGNLMNARIYRRNHTTFRGKSISKARCPFVNPVLQSVTKRRTECGRTSHRLGN